MTDRSGETSQSRHHMPHAYAELGEAFPGNALRTAQSIGQPEILAQAEVGKAAVRQAPDATPKSRAKATRKPSTRKR
jgi:hypothetical protein